MADHEAVTDDGAEDEIQALRDFHADVWGWLRERGLVDDGDDEWAGFRDTIEEHEDEIAEAAKREALRAMSTSTEGGSAAWIFTRPGDQTYPRLFTLRAAAAAHARACTADPIPDVHLVHLTTHPSASIRDDLLFGFSDKPGSPAPGATDADEGDCASIDPPPHDTTSKGTN